MSDRHAGRGRIHSGNGMTPRPAERQVCDTAKCLLTSGKVCPARRSPNQSWAQGLIGDRRLQVTGSGFHGEGWSWVWAGEKGTGNVGL